jgi:protein involved in polysaccharide export with SLBB domain
MLESGASRFWFGAMLLLCALFSGEMLHAQEKQREIIPSFDYRICAGDTVQVSVYQHPELSKTVLVKQDGSITLLKVNTVKISGLRISDVAALLQDKLEPFISKPQVTVTVFIRCVSR